MHRGIHGEKIIATLESDKLPDTDRERVKKALQVYDKWIDNLIKCSCKDLNELILTMINLLNEYKNFIDIELIFDSPNDFLYRQKGQLKLDNTVVEEFLPIFVSKCIANKFDNIDIDINSQTQTFSSMYFTSSLNNPIIGGGVCIKTKDQDFSMSRKLYIQSSYNANFPKNETVMLTTNLGYMMAEIKTNLDKTMFQEASATAHDVKLAVTGAKYYLLCDYLDMTPISTATTDIEEILILRKAKRISSNVRSFFNTHNGRMEKRSWYINYLKQHPYSVEVFKRLIEHIFSQINNETLIENNVLTQGYF